MGIPSWLALATTIASCRQARRSRGLAPLTAAETELAARLRAHVTHLAETIGPRNLERPGAMHHASAYIRAAFHASGCATGEQPFEVAGTRVVNVEARCDAAAAARRVIVVGAHYDTVAASPGANDNGSGVAALLELARLYAAAPSAAASVRFVAFANEEPPYFMTDAMGSLVYARRAAARGERVDAMLSLETIGYYSGEAGSQQYPEPFSRFLPDRGNFLAMVSNFRSAALLRTVWRAFSTATTLPAIASPAPERVPGVAWSDQWSFWQQGYPAVMLTDTAPYRYPHYHLPSDTPDKLDYERLARVVTGCASVVGVLAGAVRPRSASGEARIARR